MRHDVLDLVQRHFGRVRPSGQSNVTLRCPLHKGGQEKTPSFSINVDQGLYHCFTCHASGTIPHLLKLIGLPQEQIDIETQSIRAALSENRDKLRWRKRAQWVSEDPFSATSPLSETMLRTFEWCPTKLTDVGFNPDLLRNMEIGFDRRNNRITYPIRDLYGTLAGFVGGTVFAGEYPKYKVYQGRRRGLDGQWIAGDYGEWFDEQYPNYTFKNHDYIWNFDRVYPRLFFTKEVEQTLIIVEGFKACLWLIQNGFWNTVALMGSYMSERQLEHFRRLQCRFVLFLDNNEAGQKGTERIGKTLYSVTSGVHIAQYPPDADDGCQPDNLAQHEIQASLLGTHYPHWKRGVSA